MEKYVGTAKRSVIIKASVETVWKKLSKITKLDWLEEQKSSKFLCQSLQFSQLSISTKNRLG